MQAFSSHDIFQTLYQQIMLLELKPGSTLRENALCEQFGVSRTPVRSVLQELRIAGLIEVTPYKSTRVTQLDFDTISQQIYLRNAVESAVMTDFAAACTPEQLAQLKTRNDALRRLAGPPPPPPPPPQNELHIFILSAHHVPPIVWKVPLCEYETSE